MQFNFEKPKSNRIFQNIVDQIQDAILNGQLKTGDTLPSEMKLKEMFATSRGTIREALRVLEQKGLIDIKTGVSGGAVIKAINTEKIMEDLEILIQTQKVTFDHLAEFREGVEGNVAAMAAQRVTTRDIEKLKALLSEAKKLLEQDELDTRAFLQIDMRLHIELAQIVENPLYLANIQIVHKKVLDSLSQSIDYDKQIVARNYQDLCDMVKAIEQRDAEQARVLAQNHVRLFVGYMKAAGHTSGA
jgi:DNA-binding FadR family transcriptional regulator